MKLLEVNEGSEAPHATSMSAHALQSNPGNPVATPFKTQNGANQNQDISSSKKTKSSLNLSINCSNTNLKMNNISVKSNNCNTNYVQSTRPTRLSKRERTESESLFMDDDDLVLEVYESSHPGSVLSGINSFRRHGQFCDVKLIVEEHEYDAHRTVLATCSPYLFDILTVMEESTEQKYSYKLKDIPHLGFEYLLDFMYTGR